jgi:hypothetical protein
MHIVRAALPAAPTTMPRTCVRNVEWALPNIRFNVTNCTNQLHLVRRQTWVERPDEQRHWRHGTCGPRPHLAQPRMNIAWGLGSTATTASHRKYIYTHTHIYLKAGPTGYSFHGAHHATLCRWRCRQQSHLQRRLSCQYCLAANLERWLATMQLATGAILVRANMPCKP